MRNPMRIKVFDSPVAMNDATLGFGVPAVSPAAASSTHPYLTAAGLAFGLLAVWVALVQFAA